MRLSNDLQRPFTVLQTVIQSLDWHYEASKEFSFSLVLREVNDESECYDMMKVLPQSCFHCLDWKRRLTAGPIRLVQVLSELFVRVVTLSTLT
jgi:hypothetical protein